MLTRFVGHLITRDAVEEGALMGRPAKDPESFRRDTVRLVASSGRPVAEVARSLGIAEGTLWDWVKAAQDAAARAADPEAGRAASAPQAGRPDRFGRTTQPSGVGGQQAL